MTNFDPKYAADLVSFILDERKDNADIQFANLEYAVRSGLETVLATGENDESRDALMLAVLALGGASLRQILGEVFRLMAEAGEETATVLHWLLRQHVPVAASSTPPPASQPVAPPAPEYIRPPLPGEGPDNTGGQPVSGDPISGAPVSAPPAPAPPAPRRSWLSGGRQSEPRPSGNTADLRQ